MVNEGLAWDSTNSGSRDTFNSHDSSASFLNLQMSGVAQIPEASRDNTLVDNPGMCPCRSGQPGFPSPNCLVLCYSSCVLCFHCSQLLGKISSPRLTVQWGSKGKKSPADA